MLHLTSFLIVNVVFIDSGFFATVLAEPSTFQSSREADAGAFAYLAHGSLGSAFQTIDDLNPMAILIFSGASPMAAFRKRVPVYLPRYGFAPHGARASRTRVLVFVLISILATLVFYASVDAQGGNATSVLVLMRSAAMPCRSQLESAEVLGSSVAFRVFVCAGFWNIVQQPEGINLAAISFGLIGKNCAAKVFFREQFS